MAVCLNISTVINIKILTNSNQQTQSYKFTSHIAAFLSVVLITEMLEICIQTSYAQNVQLILKSYLPVVYGTTLINVDHHFDNEFKHCIMNLNIFGWGQLKYYNLLFLKQIVYAFKKHSKKYCKLPFRLDL